MATRRRFLKTALIAGAGRSLPKLALATEPGTITVSVALPGAVFSGDEAPLSEGTTDVPTPSFTRGVGVYPGSPEQDFGPSITLHPAAPYRNLALRRPAYHSSSYDYNLTAQLVTDGIVDTATPRWIVAVADGEILRKGDREIFTDHFQSALQPLSGPTPSVELHLMGGGDALAIDRLEIFVAVPDTVPVDRLTFTASASDDGYTWQKFPAVHGSAPLSPENYPPDLSHGAHLLNVALPLVAAANTRFFRVDFGVIEAAGSVAAAPFLSWRCGQVAFYNGATRVNVGGPYSFTSAWKSAGLDEEWIYVDLGSRFAFDNIKLHWIARAAEGKLQISDDAHRWNDLQPLPVNGGLIDDIRLASAAQARYVRVLMTRPTSPDGYMLSEIEVFGHGGFLAQPKPMPMATPDGRVAIAGWSLAAATHPARRTGARNARNR